MNNISFFTSSAPAPPSFPPLWLHLQNTKQPKNTKLTIVILSAILIVILIVISVSVSILITGCCEAYNKGISVIVILSVVVIVSVINLYNRVLRGV